MSTEVVTAITYWALVAMWSIIFVIYVIELKKVSGLSKAFTFLLVILTIDAARTLFESFYFGVYFTSYYGYISQSFHSVLSQPNYLILPKLLNLTAAILVLFILARVMLPKLINAEIKNQHKINESERRLKSAVKLSPYPMFIHTEDGEILAISDKVCQLTGFSKDEISTIKDWTDKAYGEDAASIISLINSNYHNNKRVHLGDLNVRTASGKTLIWDFNIVPLGKTDKGRKMHLACATDVTSERSSYRELIATQFTVDHAPMSIIWYNENGRVINANGFAFDTLGYDFQDLLNLNFQDLHIQHHYSWDNLLDVLHKEGKLEFYLEHVTAQRELIPIQVSLVLLDHDGEVSICEFAHDMTEWYQTHQEFKNSEERRKFALGAAQIGDWDMDLRTNIATRSFLHDKCFGYTTPVESWGYQTFLEHIHPDDRERVDKAYQAAMWTDCDYDIEFRVIWPDESIHWLWSKGRFYHDKLGNPIRVAGIQLDITKRRRQEAELRLNAAALDASTNGITIADANDDEYRIVYCNPTFEQITGYSQNEIIGENCRFLNQHTRMHNHETQRALKQLRNAMQNHESVEVELLNYKKDGTEFWNQLKIAPVRDLNNNVTHFVGIQTDISERKNAELERENLLREVKQQANLINKANDAVLSFTIDDNVSYYNQAAVNLFVLPEEKLNIPSALDLFNNSTTDFLAAKNAVLETGEWAGELDIQSNTGDLLTLESRWSLVRDELGDVDSILTINSDITSKKETEREITKLAYYDTLTKLPNRVHLLEYLDEISSSMDRENLSVAIIMLDLDNFKYLNDTFGHFMGDHLLRDVGVRLKETVRSIDFVARLGGDEFVVILTDKPENFSTLNETAETIAHKILEALNRPFFIESFEYFSSASIGLTQVRDNLIITDALKEADLAMYRAKSMGRNNVQHYDHELQKQLIQRAKIEIELRKAVNTDQLKLYLQPQHRSDGSIIGAEALLRWNSPLLGRVSPAEFIPIAESTSLILPIGEWVLEEACEILHNWHKDKHTKQLTLSINISAVQFKNNHFVERVKQIISQYDFDRTRLMFELTESVLLDGTESAVGIITELKASGIAFSLDDFGTGYSSLSYLKLLPIQELKIDQSFVRDMTTDTNDEDICKTIILLANSFNLTVIAEGVEDENQKRILEEHGCSCFQGYYFSRPMPLIEFTSYFDASQDRPIEQDEPLEPVN